MHITEIDKNFKVETSFEREGLVFKNALDEPFRIYGVFHDGEIYRRVPDGVAETVNPGVHRLARNSAGGRVGKPAPHPTSMILAPFGSLDASAAQSA